MDGIGRCLAMAMSRLPDVHLGIVAFLDYNDVMKVLYHLSSPILRPWEDGSWIFGVLYLY